MFSAPTRKPAPTPLLLPLNTRTHTHNTPSPHPNLPGFISAPTPHPALGPPPRPKPARVSLLVDSSSLLLHSSAPSPLSSRRDPWEVQQQSHPFTLNSRAYPCPRSTVRCLCQPRVCLPGLLLTSPPPLTGPSSWAGPAVHLARPSSPSGLRSGVTSAEKHCPPPPPDHSS